MPAGTSAGTYTILAVYSGTGNFSGSSDASHTLTVRPGAAYQVVFGQGPTAAVAGAAISPAVTVQVEDQYGNVVTTDTLTVTLTLSSGTFEGGSTTVTAAASSGVATFSGLKIDVTGNYTLTATDGTLVASGPGNSFKISPAAPSQLVIHTPPSATARAGQPFATQPVIYEEDRFGNLETGDSQSVVTVALNSGTRSLQGTSTATVVKGVARFTNLADSIAETITLRFTSGNLSAAISSPINITPAEAPTITSWNVVMTQKVNSKGKPVGKAYFSGFNLQFSAR